MKIIYSPYYAGGGDPNKPTPPSNAQSASVSGYFPASSQSATARNLDVRDIIAGFVGRKDKDLSDDQAKKDFAYMSTTLGRPMAQKVLNHIISFNQRSDQQKQPFESRLGSLYDIGSNDKDVDAFLKRTGSMGYGPIPGARSSSNLAVMAAEGGSPLQSAAFNKKMAMISKK